MARDVAPGPDTEEVQAFESPWRRSRRPLHGLLHGAFTFHFRAELFTRLLRARARRPRLMAPFLSKADVRFLRRERRRELSMIARSLRDLGTAQRAGLLAPAGRRLVAGLRAWHRRLGAGMAGGSR
jgi:HEXXH motif-containing protein